jgi:hypothetical protein
MNISKKDCKLIQLLPNYFRWIGLIITLLPILFLIIARSLNNELFQAHKETIKIFSINVFILGLLFIVLTKDKIEDEMTMLLRLRAMAFIFIVAVIYVITQPLIDWIWNDTFSILNSRHLVVIMLISYIIYFFILKKWR